MKGVFTSDKKLLGQAKLFYADDKRKANEEFERLVI
jgi:hypothetical protein